MQTLAKFLLIGGATLMLCGLLLWIGSRFFPGGVPGDLSFRRGNTSIYFPIVSSIILSIVATIVLNIIARIFWR